MNAPRFSLFIALLALTVSCSGGTATSDASVDHAEPDPDLAGDIVAIDTTADLAVGPLPGCETFNSCCTAPGVPGAGTVDDECGSNGLPCENCAFRGEACRDKDDGQYFCTEVLADGEPCNADWECASEVCSGGRCETPCAKLGEPCDANLAAETCCESRARCAGGDHANTFCCYPAGTTVTVSQCTGCCSPNGCDFVSQGQYVCKD